MTMTCTGCGKPIAQAEALYMPDGRVVCAACFAAADLKATTARAGGGLGLGGAGLIAAVIPFFAHFSTSSSTSVNGVVTGTYRDYIAIGGGAVAIVLGGFGVLRARKVPRALLLSIGAIALGAFQLARGFGVFEAKAETSSHITSTPEIETPPIPTAKPPDICATRDECFELAQKLEPTDKPGALAAYRRACDLGSAGGCGNAGNLAPDSDAAALYERGCTLDGPEPCANFGAMLIEGKVVPQDYDHARKVLEHACDRDSGLGCRDLAVLYQDGLGVDKDAAKALELIEKACKLEDAQACDSLGVKTLNGTGVKKDAKRAAELFGQACKLDDEQCYDYGVALEQGLSGKKNLAEARAAYDKSCAALEPKACHNLGVLLEHGQGGAKDVDKAKHMYEEACDMGYKDDCKP